MMKKCAGIAVAVLLMMLTCMSSRAQDKDSLLDKEVGKLEQHDMDALINRGLLRQGDVPMLAIYLLQAVNNGSNISAVTYGQLLDSFQAYKSARLATIVRPGTGTDSVFIRTPDEQYNFLGMGEMSFEKIVARESEHLPQQYEGDANLRIDSSVESATALAKLSQSTEDYSWAVGNVLLVKRDSGELTTLRRGDVLEIARRVAGSKEMAAFTDRLK